jgi:hypothetical protein
MAQLTEVHLAHLWDQTVEDMDLTVLVVRIATIVTQVATAATIHIILPRVTVPAILRQYGLLQVRVDLLRAETSPWALLRIPVFPQALACRPSPWVPRRIPTWACTAVPADRTVLRPCLALSLWPTRRYTLPASPRCSTRRTRTLHPSTRAASVVKRCTTTTRDGIHQYF